MTNPAFPPAPAVPAAALTSGQIDSFVASLPNRAKHAAYWLGRAQVEPCRVWVQPHGPAADLRLEFCNVSIRLGTGAAAEIAARKAELDALTALAAEWAK